MVKFLKAHMAPCRALQNIKVATAEELALLEEALDYFNNIGKQNVGYKQLAKQAGVQAALWKEGDDMVEDKVVVVEEKAVEDKADRHYSLDYKNSDLYQGHDLVDYDAFVQVVADALALKGTRRVAEVDTVLKAVWAHYKDRLGNDKAACRYFCVRVHEAFVDYAKAHPLHYYWFNVGKFLALGFKQAAEGR